MDYKDVKDDRDTDNGMTPSKAISRPTNPSVKPPLGMPGNMKQTSSPRPMRVFRSQGR